MTGNPREKRAAGAGNDGSSREERGSLRRMPGESAKGEEKLRALESKFTMDPAFCNSFFLLVCRKRRRWRKENGFGRPGGKAGRKKHKNDEKYQITSMEKRRKRNTLLKIWTIVIDFQKPEERGAEKSENMNKLKTVQILLFITKIRTIFLYKTSQQDSGWFWRRKRFLNKLRDIDITSYKRALLV